MVLTPGMTRFREAKVRRLRRSLPYVQPVGAGLMTAAGEYIIFYRLTLGSCFSQGGKCRYAGS